MNLRRVVLLTTLLIGSGPAWGCSQPYFTPEEKFKTHSVVVLAHPIGVLNEPANALASTFRGTFRQTIQWQVLVAWKGKVEVGDVLLTRVSYQGGGLCGDGAVRRREATLLYLDGTEPFEKMMHARPSDSMSDMKYLSQKPRDG